MNSLSLVIIRDTLLVEKYGQFETATRTAMVFSNPPTAAALITNCISLHPSLSPPSDSETASFPNGNADKVCLRSPPSLA